MEPEEGNVAQKIFELNLERIEQLLKDKPVRSRTAGGRNHDSGIAKHGRVRGECRGAP